MEDIKEVTIDFDFKPYAPQLAEVYKVWLAEDKKYLSYLTDKILLEYCPNLHQQVTEALIASFGSSVTPPQVRIRWQDLYYVMQDAGIEIKEKPFLKVVYEPIFPYVKKPHHHFPKKETMMDKLKAFFCGSLHRAGLTVTLNDPLVGGDFVEGHGAAGV